MAEALLGCSACSQEQLDECSANCQELCDRNLRQRLMQDTGLSAGHGGTVKDVSGDEAVSEVGCASEKYMIGVISLEFN